MRRNKYPISLPQNGLCLNTLQNNLSAALIALPQQGIEHIHAIGTRIQRHTRKRSKRRKKIDLTDQRIRLPGFHSTGPGNDKRHAGTPIVHTVFSPAQRTCRAVITAQLNRLIVIPIIQHRTIITGKNHNRIFFQPTALKRIEHLANTPIHLGNRIAARTQTSAPHKSGMGQPRNMGLVERVIQEKRIILVLFHK